MHLRPPCPAHVPRRCARPASTLRHTGCAALVSHQLLDTCHVNVAARVNQLVADQRDKPVRRCTLAGAAQRLGTGSFPHTRGTAAQQAARREPDGRHSSLALIVILSCDTRRRKGSLCKLLLDFVLYVRVCGPYPVRRCWTAPCRCVSHWTDGLRVPRARKLLIRRRRTVCHSLTSTQPHLYAHTTTESTNSPASTSNTCRLLVKAPQAWCSR